jgi:putative copper resistance protein D
VRARYKEFGTEDRNAAEFAAQAAILANEPLVEISLHSH